jgi:5-methyltetrahydrofolate--homocysteine methyltransferase
METPDLSQLSDDDLWLQMQDDLYEGMKDDVAAETQAALDRGYSPQDVLGQGLVAGMDVVGADFRDGVLFVPEVLMAANAMKAGMELLRPLLTETGAEPMGKMVIGTVKGDIHDIGKNLVAMMMEGAGFEVINLGVNNDAQKFIDAIHQHQPEIIGMSALLTTTMPYMKVVIEALKDENLRDKIFVMVGGAPVTETFAMQVGADAYGRDAATAVDLAKAYMSRRRVQTVTAA